MQNTSFQLLQMQAQNNSLFNHPLGGGGLQMDEYIKHAPQAMQLGTTFSFGAPAPLGLHLTMPQQTPLGMQFQLPQINLGSLGGQSQ